MSFQDRCGQVLAGRYRVDSVLHEGPVTAVLAARELPAGTRVAIKMLAPHAVANKVMAARFAREAEVCSQLTVSLGAMGYALIKALVFGLVVSTVNAHHGLAVARSFTEIPRANTRAAVQCYALCIAANAVTSLHALPRTLQG